MKRVLKDLNTGLFFKSMDEWTSQVAAAVDFHDTVAALRFCEKHNLSGVAILLVSAGGKLERVLGFRHPHASAAVRMPAAFPAL
jgi:hypothetical protein